MWEGLRRCGCLSEWMSGRQLNWSRRPLVEELYPLSTLQTRPCCPLRTECELFLRCRKCRQAHNPSCTAKWPSVIGSIVQFQSECATSTQTLTLDALLCALVGIDVGRFIGHSEDSSFEFFRDIKMLRRKVPLVSGAPLIPVIC